MGSGKNCSFVQYRTTTHTHLEIWPGFSSNRNLLIIELLHLSDGAELFISFLWIWLDFDFAYLNSLKIMFTLGKGQLKSRNFNFLAKIWSHLPHFP